MIFLLCILLALAGESKSEYNWYDTVLARELHQAPRAIFGSRPVFLERGVIDAYVERAFSEKHPLVRFPPTLHAPAALRAPPVLQDARWQLLEDGSLHDMEWSWNGSSPIQLIIVTDGSLHLSTTIDIVAHVPHNSFIAIGGPRVAHIVSKLNGVLWIGALSRLQRTARAWDAILPGVDALLTTGVLPANLGGIALNVSHFLATAGVFTDSYDRVILEVVFPPLLAHSASPSFAKAVVLELKKGMARWSPLFEAIHDNEKVFIHVHVSGLSAAVNWLGAHRAVHWVAPVFRFSYQNKKANEVLQNGVFEAKTPVWDIGITATNQVVGVGDTGADRRKCYLAGEHKFVMYRNTSVGDQEDSDGHGTHVCGSLAGDSSTGQSNGVAKHARIAFTDLGGSNGGFRVPTNLGDDYFAYAYEAGARTHTDSWGRADFSYSQQAFEVDRFLHEHKYFTSLFSVGNYGDCESAHCGSENSASAPSTAKNVIAVGATKSTYSDFPSYINNPTWNIDIAGDDAAHWKHHLIRGIEAEFSMIHGGAIAETEVFGHPEYACDDSYASNMTGKIVLVRRGVCAFLQKALNAQTAGALAVIVTNNEPCRFVITQGTTTEEMRITVVAIPKKDGDLLYALIDNKTLYKISDFGTGEPCDPNMGASRKVEFRGADHRRQDKTRCGSTGRVHKKRRPRNDATI